ncbi:Tyrosinase-like protein orsC [Apiospora phragmitis]|uniref:Tyrosinase-like protein orsC n=1 Tax=Apiospora phragmitis TaxID=2905665 RepID=A0ABR1VD02_9PEZI
MALRLAASTTAAVPHDSLRMLHDRAMANPMAARGGQTALARTAVQCMFMLPSQSDKSWAAGARVRYDDWPATHINQTRFIHNTGNFLTYHRYLTWTYERALREACGYNGTQPYWKWFKYQADPTKNPLMDGSDTSMGGNGAYVEHNGTLAAGIVYLPSGPGGGCIERGPFANLTVNLGPINPAMRGMPAGVPDGTNTHNPRCLRRDLSTHASAPWHTYANLLNVTTGGPVVSSDVSVFQTELQGRPPDTGFRVCTQAATTPSAATTRTNFSSAVDPLFWFHHAMGLHPGPVARGVMGTRLARDASLSYTQRSDVLEMGATGQSRVLEDLLDTMGGTPACYIYEY